ncbi:MAG: hypothetical protein M1820_009283 [Bogoriella megaspora]|nr:MAG: hypothetical protein M1820_009283 [Bogoriella megaspora]
MAGATGKSQPLLSPAKGVRRKPTNATPNRGGLSDAELRSIATEAANRIETARSRQILMDNATMPESKMKLPATGHRDRPYFLGKDDRRIPGSHKAKVLFRDGYKAWFVVSHSLFCTSCWNGLQLRLIGGNTEFWLGDILCAHCKMFLIAWRFAVLGMYQRAGEVDAQAIQNAFPFKDPVDLWASKGQLSLKISIEGVRGRPYEYLMNRHSHCPRCWDNCVGLAQDGIFMQQLVKFCSFCLRAVVTWAAQNMKIEDPEQATTMASSNVPTSTRDKVHHEVNALIAGAPAPKLKSAVRELCRLSPALRNSLFTLLNTTVEPSTPIKEDPGLQVSTPAGPKNAPVTTKAESNQTARGSTPYPRAGSSFKVPKYADVVDLDDDEALTKHAGDVKPETPVKMEELEARTPLADVSTKDNAQTIKKEKGKEPVYLDRKRRRGSPSENKGPRKRRRF